VLEPLAGSAKVHRHPARSDDRACSGRRCRIPAQPVRLYAGCAGTGRSRGSPRIFKCARGKRASERLSPMSRTCRMRTVALHQHPIAASSTTSFRANGAAEVTSIFCALDNVWVDALHEARYGSGSRAGPPWRKAPTRVDSSSAGLQRPRLTRQEARWSHRPGGP
jgi:hypothetical protein